MNKLLRSGLVASAVAGLTLAATTASATPGSGVTGTIISQTTIDGKDYVLREITIEPGGSTGWHFHDGTLYAYVKQGTLSHFNSSCGTDGTYKKGAFFTEPSGADHVHVGRNLGSEPMVLDVLYVDPAGSPLSEDAPNPGCDFQ
ncbi:cupin domain-containing protein [Streptomyces sp. TS71-3]|uniref:cupin domain-containing protein n=1 Tax=Streptomyces sp. TS71-3 TaxID=2733862 RepID=UPI001B24DD9F|nr:cupin domain-containing protein [Streptomyces sp. TS71-3]GHJ40998.1 cupin [Streptomyces sp. TS71-3]